MVYNILSNKKLITKRGLMKKIRLGVNIDHVATLGNARNEGFSKFT